MDREADPKAEQPKRDSERTVRRGSGDGSADKEGENGGVKARDAKVGAGPRDREGSRERSAEREARYRAEKDERKREKKERKEKRKEEKRSRRDKDGSDG